MERSRKGHPLWPENTNHKAAKALQLVVRTFPLSHNHNLVLNSKQKNYFGSDLSLTNLHLPDSVFIVTRPFEKFSRWHRWPLADVLQLGEATGPRHDDAIKVEAQGGDQRLQEAVEARGQKGLACLQVFEGEREAKHGVCLQIFKKNGGASGRGRSKTWCFPPPLSFSSPFLPIPLSLSLCLPVCLSACLPAPVCLSVGRSVGRSSIYLPIDLSIYQSIHLSICESMDLSIDISIYGSIYGTIELSIYRSIYLSIYLSTYLSIYLSIYPSTNLPICLFIFYRFNFLSVCRSIDLSI